MTRSKAKLPRIWGRYGVCEKGQMTQLSVWCRRMAFIFGRRNEIILSATALAAATAAVAWSLSSRLGVDNLVILYGNVDIRATEEVSDDSARSSESRLRKGILSGGDGYLGNRIHGQSGAGTGPPGCAAVGALAVSGDAQVPWGSLEPVSQTRSLVVEFRSPRDPLSDLLEHQPVISAARVQ
jgi:hypothetical protein